MVIRAFFVENEVPSGIVSVMAFTLSSAAAWPSQVMRVSVAPFTSFDPSALGRAVHFAVSSASALAGCAQRPTKKTEHATAIATNTDMKESMRFCMRSP